jgi:hypothetical protein
MRSLFSRIVRVVLALLVCALSQHGWLVTHHCAQQDLLVRARAPVSSDSSLASALLVGLGGTPLDHTERDLPEPHQHGRGPVIAFLGQTGSSLSKALVPVHAQRAVLVDALLLATDQRAVAEQASERFSGDTAYETVEIVFRGYSFIATPSQGPPGLV